MAIRDKQGANPKEREVMHDEGLVLLEVIFGYISNKKKRGLFYRILCFLGMVSLLYLFTSDRCTNDHGTPIPSQMTKH